jgi:hypothetical protein
MKSVAMQVTIDLPDDVAEHLRQRWGDAVPRLVKEALATEGYRSGELTHAQVGRMLGLTHFTEIEEFLKRTGAHLHYDLEDFERDLQAHRDLGL